MCFIKVGTMQMYTDIQNLSKCLFISMDTIVTSYYRCLKYQSMVSNQVFCIHLILLIKILVAQSTIENNV